MVLMPLYFCSVGFRRPSEVDMEMTEPCENPDAYRYILQYHCGDDMDPGSSSHHDDDSSSHDGMDSRRPGPSSTHYDGSSSRDGMDSRRPVPSSSHRDPSSSIDMSDSRRPDPSSELHGSSQFMSGADHSPSGSMYPSHTQPGQDMSSGYNTGPDHHTNTPPPSHGDACM